MTTTPPNPDITVRGGIINVPLSTTCAHSLRHQPDTPRTKKRTTTKTDHIHSPTSPTPETPPTPPEPTEEIVPEAPPNSEGDPNGTTPPSQSD